MTVQYKMVVEWDADLRDVGFIDTLGPTPDSVKGLVIEAIKITTGAPAATVGKFAPGAEITNVISGLIYRMSGTTASPAWEDIQSGITLPFADNFSAPATDTSTKAFRINLTIPAAAGSSDATDPRNFAAVWGSVNGASLTASANYMAGVIGVYNIITANASLYPKAGVIGWIAGDDPTGTADADAAVLALLDGDGGIVNANAAFGVRIANSAAGSGFVYGLDLAQPTKLKPSDVALSYSRGDIRMLNLAVIASGAATTDASIKTAMGYTAPAGSIYMSSNGVGEIWIMQTTTWTKLTIN